MINNKQLILLALNHLVAPVYENIIRFDVEMHSEMPRHIIIICNYRPPLLSFGEIRDNITETIKKYCNININRHQVFYKLKKET